MLTILLNACPQQVEFQRNGMLHITLLYKEGNMADLSNQRPISLLETTCKILSKVITRRITSTLDHIKPREQADFRYDYLTLDHLKSITQLIEKTMRPRMPLVVTFIDYQEAFDSITHQEFIKYSKIKELKMST